MSTTLVSLQEYLHTAYSPDREYVDGVVLERHVGEGPHSGVQSNLVFYLRMRYSQLRVWPEHRIRINETRWRVPDVCVTIGNPRVTIFDFAPYIVVEILSPEDTIPRVSEKLEEYANLGVPNIWLMDPMRRKAFVYRERALHEVKDTELTTTDLEVSITLEQVFFEIDAL